MSNESERMLHCAPTIAWVKDLDQILLVEGDGERWWTIRGAEAAIWDLLTLGYRFDTIVHFLSILLDVPDEEAQATLLTTLQTWKRAGMVQVAGGNGHG